MMKICESELKARLAKVKLLALDVDGILTDGGLYYTENGEELKKFNVKDGLGIKLLMKLGVEVAIISANSSRSTYYRAKKLGITNCFLGVEEKFPILQKLCHQLNISLSQVAYMGDDLTDLPILKSVGCPMTVADAIQNNKENSIYISSKAGGQGAVREVCELIQKAVTSSYGCK